MRPLIYSLLLLFLGTATANAANKPVDIDKVIEKNFPIDANGTFEVSNKYGNVNITEWNKNEISIKVTINVKTSNQKKADEIFDRIDVNFEDSKSYVSAKTEIESKDNGLFNWGSGNDTEFQIDYDIQMPQTVHLNCSNKYGNTFVTDLNNGAEIYMGYGNIRLGSVEGETSLVLSYSNIDFGDLGALDIDAKYSNVKGSSTQELKVNSKYSNFDLGDVASLKADTKNDKWKIDKVGKITNLGKYDNWNLGQVSSLDTDSKYTSFKIDELSGNLDMDQKYGSLKIGQVVCKDAEIRVDVEHTDISINLGGCNNYSVDFEGEYTGTRLPSNFDSEMDEDGKRSWLRGTKGNGDLRITVRMEYGTLKLK